MTLSAEQREALANGQPVPVLVDRKECVLMPKEMYERVKNLIYDNGDLSEGEMNALLAQIGEQAGWMEPDMDVYDNYEEERKKQCR